MHYYSHEEVAYTALFDLRLAECELLIYDGCIRYVIKNCPDEMLYKITGCKTKKELGRYRLVHDIETGEVIGSIKTLVRECLKERIG